MAVNDFLILLVIGLVAGFASGLLGVGGAIIIIPSLVYFMAMPQHMAQGTSLAVLLLPVGIFAVINYYKSGNVNLPFAVIIVLGFLIGSYFSSKMAIDIPEKTIKRLFAALLLLIGLKMLWGK